MISGEKGLYIHYIYVRTEEFLTRLQFYSLPPSSNSVPSILCNAVLTYSVVK